MGAQKCLRRVLDNIQMGSTLPNRATKQKDKIADRRSGALSQNIDPLVKTLLESKVYLGFVPQRMQHSAPRSARLDLVNWLDPWSNVPTR